MRIAIGLGSNIDPEDNLRAAAIHLRTAFRGARFSRVYESAPLLFAAQPPFLNAVMIAGTDLSPLETHAVLKDIEQALKKDPPVRYGPRTIDLDLLLYGDIIFPSIDEWKTQTSPSTRLRTSKPANELTRNPLAIPHHRMHERRFVLEPLCELIEPQERHPALAKSWGELLEKTEEQDCEPTPVIL